MDVRLIPSGFPSRFLQALEIRKRFLDTEPDSVASTLYNIGKLYLNHGDFAKAEQLSKQALSLFDQFRPDSPEAAYVLRRLAVIYMQQERFTEAQSLLQRSLDIRTCIFGDDHPEIAKSLYSFAELYLLQGNLTKSNQFLHQTLAIYENAYGSNHTEVAKTLEKYANLLRKTERSGGRGA